MNEKMLSHLNRAGDPRVGQRGKFNPQAAFNYFDHAAADAADSLRRLVKRTYPDHVEEVTTIIRDRYDDANIPDADENATTGEAITSFNAITAFYHQIREEIERGTFVLPQTEPETIYEMAKEAIENKQQWTAGETVTLWSNKTYKVSITEGGNDGGGLLYLDMYKATHGKPVSTVAGMLIPLAGWQFTLTLHDYNTWASKAKWTFKIAIPAWKPDITMDFGKGDLSQFREGRLSPEYRKRAMRARSLR